MKILQRTEEEENELQMFSDELEYRWRRSLPKPTERELIEYFSPQKEMLVENLIVAENRQQERMRAMRRCLEGIYAMTSDDFSRWFWWSVMKLDYQPEFDGCNRYIAKLRRMLAMLSPESKKADMQDEIERARQYPICEVARHHLTLRSCGNKFSSLCPFHEEKHASFYIYPETNTFHCFGCGAHGDVITLMQHLYGLSFREAVKELQ